jgi:ribosome-binding protein aMBF1 (putative translation factor)
VAGGEGKKAPSIIDFFAGFRTDAGVASQTLAAQEQVCCLKVQTGRQGAVGAENGPAWRSVNSAVNYLLNKLNSQPSPPDPTLTTRERNIIIRARHAAGVSQAELARQFGISYQRVHQIVHQRRK